MTFVTWPVAAIAAGVVIPTLIILYFLKLRRRDMEVSSTLLWKKAIQDLQANAPFQKLRNNILLILQLLALIAALFALAQPEFKAQSTLNLRQVIMIDRSASMSTTDGASDPAAPPASTGQPGAPTGSSITRLEAAKKKALELVDALREPGLFSLDDKAEEAMVIAFDSGAQVLQTFTSSKAELRSAINSIQPTAAPTSLQQAYDLAKAYTGTKRFEDQVVEKTADNKPAGFIPSSPGATLHLFTDGRMPDASRVQTALEDRVVFHPVGSPETPNVGITGLRADRAFDNPGRVNIFIGLQSTDLSARTVDLELTIDGTLATVREVTIPPATRPTGVDASIDDEKDNRKKTDVVPSVWPLVVPLDRAQGGVVVVRISSKAPDEFNSDNAAYVVVPPAKRLAVALVTIGNLFVQDALSGMNLSKLDIKTPDEFQKLVDADQLGQYDVLVLDRTLPEIKLDGGKRGPGLPVGRALVLGAVPPPPLGVIDDGPGEADVFIDIQRDHPALKLAELDKTNIFKARKVRLAPETPVKVLARTKQGPGLVEVTDSASTALVVCFDPTDSDWVFAQGFVVFLVDAVRYLTQTQAGAFGEAVRPGDTLTTRLPRGAGDIALRMPSGDRIRLEAAPDGTVNYGPIDRTGVFNLSWSGPGGATDIVVDGRAQRPVTSNLLDPDESEIGTRTSLPMAREIVQGQDDRKANTTRKVWPYLLLACLAIVMFEWFIYNRKVAL